MVYDICRCRCTQQVSRAWYLRALAVHRESCEMMFWMLLAQAFGSSIVHKRRPGNFSEAEHAEHPTNSCFGFSPAQFLPPGQKLIAYRLYREERASFGSCLNPRSCTKLDFLKSEILLWMNKRWTLLSTSVCFPTPYCNILLVVLYLYWADTRHAPSWQVAISRRYFHAGGCGNLMKGRECRVENCSV